MSDKLESYLEEISHFLSGKDEREAAGSSRRLASHLLLARTHKGLDRLLYCEVALDKYALKWHVYTYENYH